MLSANEFSKENFENTKPFLIQTKLSVGAAEDPFEREADAMADRVMRVPNSSFIQRKCAACEHEEEQIHRKITPFIQKQGNGLDGGTASESVTNQIESSRGGGNRMSENTLNFMESRFGSDFSGVNIHTNSNAVQMSRELNAQAFTVGSDIYFNAGKYAPDSDSGRHLLAHELTHTVQQRGGIDRKIQRGFWGTVGGVIVGGVGGFLVGGPIGAVVGGVAGGMAGDAVTTHTRSLNSNELMEAIKVFGSSLDYSKVSVTDSSALMPIGGYARTPGNTVYFPSGTLGRTDSGYFAFLIHELTHTWQTQHGVSVFTKIRNSLSSSNYNFGGDAGLKKAFDSGKCFNDFNTEAQASILEQYYGILVGLKNGDISIYTPFVNQVQSFRGNCK